MQKAIAQLKTKLPRVKNPQEIWKIWKRACGIWEKKKTEPIKYLRKIRKEWERIL